ncbi:MULTISPECIES: tail fiber domain-containing protein [Rahnella]|uniref:Tail fiber domain-containing protein n=1 Tax=Rahnella laticis TaxID=2787622 RepID=A0ABS0DZ38_9GAMM|nr:MULTISPECIES: tail fiber domain-containing protein [Rahnella]MBF7978142.1 tail fiber domain-containing protein [Rahnella laticis]MBF7998141.1 tail fiber domain-containing protein [Rahnella sp. LAC-M12]
MSVGTIALTNNSANVTGTGTAFTTDLKANDFIVAIVGGVTYTLAVKAITSATALTLITPYGGPTATGNAWTAVPNSTMVGITAQIAADVSKAIRGLNLDKANWQQVFSGTGTITVTLPDGSSYTGPAWSSITTSLAGKAARGANNDITSLAGLTTALSVTQGGTGGNTQATARTGLGLGSAATATIGTAGATVPLCNTNNNFAGVNTFSATGFAVTKPPASIDASQNMNWIYSSNAGGAYAYARQNIVGSFNALTFALGASGAEWSMYLRQNGDVVATAGQFLGQSDNRIKDKVEPITDPLIKMRNITGAKWVRLDTGRVGFGFIAQDVQKDFPEAVTIGGTTVLKDGTEVDGTLVVDTNSVAAALHHQAILALMDKVEALEARLAELQTS